MKEKELETDEKIRVANLYSDLGLEYVKFERERKREIEIRAGVSLALIGVLITLILNLLDFSYWKNASNIIEVVGYLTITVLLCIPLITILKSLHYLLKVILTKGYNGVNIPAITDKILEESLLKTQRNIFKSHQDYIKQNRSLNQEKALDFNNGVRWLKYTLISLVIVFVVFSIIKSVLS
ncbi:hypothetical protein [Sporosarcina sp. UB5]|uniref:hypothetical protein n=1 Tax=Sporosarcina sp. UB5 TaxID=3047463 RepID=UPI003D7B7E6F